MANKPKNKAASKKEKLSALPPRTSSFDKKSGVQKSGAIKLEETKNSVTYQWTEDKGGSEVQVKKRMYLKDHAKAMTEEDWIKTNGNHCKINKEKFDEGYENVFGKRELGASTGKFNKSRKKY